jgi:hypothetical protein
MIMAWKSLKTKTYNRNFSKSVVVVRYSYKSSLITNKETKQSLLIRILQQ